MNEDKLDFKTTKLAEDVAEAVMCGLVKGGELIDPTQEKLEEIQQRLHDEKNQTVVVMHQKAIQGIKNAKSPQPSGYKGKRRRKKWW